MNDTSTSQHDNKNTVLKGAFGAFELSSVFQPIFSLSHKRAIGHEALLRARDSVGCSVSPLEVFASVRNDDETIALDRSSRTLHAHNYQLLGEEGWLFMNINPKVVVEGKRYGPFFSELLARNNLRPRQIVVEILESAIRDEGLLSEAVNYYRELGCLVAIDDFGAGHSNFERIINLEPDIVKLDRSLLLRANSNPLARRILPNLVELLHEAGCLVVLEGIETRDEAMLALDSGTDFAQGFFFARPAPPGEIVSWHASDFDTLLQDFKRQIDRGEKQWEMDLSPYRVTFEHAAASYAAGADLDVACFRLLTRERVIRCYVLDEQGVQVGNNACPTKLDYNCDGRYRPLHMTAGADWSRKPYFRRAIKSPRQLQVTRPYLSITGARMCVTLSMAIERENEVRVICCDVSLES